MRIRCNTLGEFLANLRTAAAYRRIVHFSREREPLNGRNREDATAWEVWFRVSCVLQFVDGGQALLEAVELCGIDRLSADGNRAGSERQGELTSQLEEYCRNAGLSMVPGIVELQ